MSHIGIRIDKDAAQPGVVRRVSADEKNTGLRGDGDDYLIGDLQTTSPFKTFLLQKDENVL